MKLAPLYSVNTELSTELLTLDALFYLYRLYADLDWMESQYGGIGFPSETLSAAKLVYEKVHEGLNGQLPSAQDEKLTDLEAALQTFICKVEGKIICIILRLPLLLLLLLLNSYNLLE